MLLVPLIIILYNYISYMYIGICYIQLHININCTNDYLLLLIFIYYNYLPVLNLLPAYLQCLIYTSTLKNILQWNLLLLYIHSNFLVSVYVYVCMCKCVCVHVCMCVCACVCVPVCVYMCSTRKDTYGWKYELYIEIFLLRTLCGDQPKTHNVFWANCVKSYPYTKLHSRSPKHLPMCTPECRPIVFRV